MLSKANVELTQGINRDDREFGYVSGDGGGFFFDWMPTLEETLDSINEDEMDGDGGLDADEVRDFLETYLPTTGKGRRAWDV